MTPRRVAAGVIAFGSIPLCGAVAAGAVHLANGLIGETIPSSCGKRGLVVGLLGIWGMVLFGCLLGQVAWLTEIIAPCVPRAAGPDRAPASPASEPDRSSRAVWHEPRRSASRRRPVRSPDRRSRSGAECPERTDRNCPHIADR